MQLSVVQQPLTLRIINQQEPKILTLNINTAHHKVALQTQTSTPTKRKVLPPVKIKLPRVNKYTLDIVKERGNIIHEGRVSYHKVEPHMVVNSQSKIPLVCNKCYFEWEMTIQNHLTGKKNSCPCCGGKVHMNKKLFLIKAAEKHPQGIFDYSMLEDDMFQGYESKIPIKCRCGHIWKTSVAGHLCGHGCPQCGRDSWTLARLLLEGPKHHGNKYDYTRNTSDMLSEGHKSKIIVYCGSCQREWNTTIKNHINGNTGCPTCPGFRWTRERVLIEGNKINGHKYDYTRNSPDMDMTKGVHTTIRVYCNKCCQEWYPTINGHLNTRRGCLNCSGRKPWTYEKFILKGHEIHGNSVHYNATTPEMITNKQSEVCVFCMKCRNYWRTTVASHINLKTGCSRCSSSRGEKICAEILTLRDIEFIREFVMDMLPRKRYDFRFEHAGCPYVLEFDGVQHFERVEHFHKTEQDFIDRQEIDILKTQHALNNGYSVIRIDYTNVNNVNDHILEAFSLKKRLYVSDPEMYTYITDRIPAHFLD